jgi:hypothetical protein
MNESTLMGDSLKEILSMGTPLGLIQVWEYRGSTKRARYFYSLDWKITENRYNAFTQFGLQDDLGFMWKCDALRYSKELVETIQHITEKIERNKTSLHSELYRADMEKRLQAKLDALRNRYCMNF